MKADTRLFGKIEIADDRIITLKEGIIGFPDLQKFALIHDEEREKGKIKWLQSMDDPTFALPVIDPLEVNPLYHPIVSEEQYEQLGDALPEQIYMLVTITVPKQIEQMSVNLKAPFIINIENLEGAQIIVEDDYPVKYKIYNLLQQGKEADE